MGDTPLRCQEYPPEAPGPAAPRLLEPLALCAFREPVEAAETPSATSEPSGDRPRRYRPNYSRAPARHGARRTRRPSDAQGSGLQLGHVSSTAVPLSLTSPVPSIRIRNNCETPLTTRANTTCWPSGDQRGMLFCAE